MGRLEAFLRSPAGNNLGHIGEGLILMLPAGLAFGWLTVWLVQTFYFLGRERRDHEIAAGLNPFMDWARGWNIFNWSADEKRDLLVPIVVNGAVAALIVVFNNGGWR